MPRSTTSKPSCANCKFYLVRPGHEDKYGFCHRWVPDGLVGRWPQVNPGKWCGEFKRKTSLRKRKEGESTIQVKDLMQSLSAQPADAEVQIAIGPTGATYDPVSVYRAQDGLVYIDGERVEGSGWASREPSRNSG